MTTSSNSRRAQALQPCGVCGANCAAADRGDEITNVVGEIPVIDGKHANIVADNDEAREVHRADIVQSGKYRILVFRDRGLARARLSRRK
jgi:hypothetical protein